MGDYAKSEMQRGIFLPLPSELRALPDLNIVRAQMLAVARDVGIGGVVSPQCAQVLSMAMDVS